MRPYSARLVAGLMVPKALDAFCALHQVWGEKPKRILARVRELNEGLATLVESCYSAGIDPRLAVVIADRVLAPFGGRIREYTSERRSV